MSFKESNMLPLGSVASDFSLPDVVSGRTVHLKELRSNKATVIMFICNHCPYVIHVNPELKRLSDEYMQKGVSFIAISSNDIEHYPQDGPDEMLQLVRDNGFNFPYLYDATQEVAKAYDAACTPDFYVFDAQLKLVYRGRLDDSKPNSGIPLTGKDLRKALDGVLAGEDPIEVQYPSGGCNIKWK